MDPIKISSTIPLSATTEKVFFTLVADGAALVRFHAGLFAGGNLDHQVVSYPSQDRVGQEYLLEKGTTLHGKRLVCSGLAFSGGDKDTVKLHCLFTFGDKVERSKEARIDLSSATISREYYFFCDFQ